MVYPYNNLVISSQVPRLGNPFRIDYLMSHLLQTKFTMHHSYDRQKSKERSRDRQRRFHTKSPSQDSNPYQRKERIKYPKTKAKRVKQAFISCNHVERRFEGMDDIRIFRKQDEPAAKGLTEDDIFKIKAEIQKEIAKSYDFNWEHYKHRDALLENHSIKEQKEKEKVLSEKLMAAKESISYFFPPRLLKCEGLIDRGCDSIENGSHSERIHDILGCYYTHVNEIPNEPQFEILNTNTTVDSKTIKFDNNLFYDRTPTPKAADSKPIKGILKSTQNDLAERSKSQPRQVDPHLINMLKDFKINPQLYSKEKTEQLLKPYKDSGELDYLMKNKQVLQAMLKSISHYSSQPKPNYPPINMPPIANQTPERSNSQQAQYPQAQQAQMNMGYNHTFVPKADKFRTVPCKYYHSPQGCSKVDNCTFIHDQRFAGTPLPNTNFTPTVQPTQPAPRMPPTSYPPSNYGYSMPPMNPNMAPNSNYYRQPMGYPPASNPNFYGSTAPQAGMSNYQSYAVNKGPPASQYMQNGQYMTTAPQQQAQQGYNVQQSQSFSQGQVQGQPPQFNGQGYANNPNYQYYIGPSGNK